MIYLDHNATSPLRPQVRETMVECLAENYGNPASQHALGRKAWNIVEEARESIASLLGANPSEIVFTSGGTESNHLALFGTFYADIEHQRKIVISQAEHPSVHEAFNLLRDRGAAGEYVLVDKEARIDLPHLESLLQTNNTILSIQGANHETGTIQPLAEAVRLAKERGAIVHSDLVQWIGKLPFSVADSGIDLASVAPHKFGGPKGIGILFIRKGTKWKSGIPGAQEEGRRGGTPDVAAIAGAGVAARLLIQESSHVADVALLRDELWRGMAQLPGVIRFSPEFGILPNTLMIGIDTWNADRLVAALDRAGLAVSAGSACSSGAGRPSPVLLAMDYHEEIARKGVRLSLGWNTTHNEIIEAIRIFSQVAVSSNG